MYTYTCIYVLHTVCIVADLGRHYNMNTPNLPTNIIPSKTA